MKALSIVQPWASLIVGGPLAAGAKRIERNGTIRLHWRGGRGSTVCLGASKRPAKEWPAKKDGRNR